MFSEEVFIADCVAFLGTNDYEDYNDVKFDIDGYVDAYLPSSLYSSSLFSLLCAKILTAYMESDHELLDVNVEDEEDDILFRSIEIWLAADGVLFRGG